MSEKILKALMQLFAIGAGLEKKTFHSRAVVEAFLKQQLNSASVLEYLSLYDYHVRLSQAEEKSVLNFDKARNICTEINKDLSTRQKYVVLIRLMEFILSESKEVSISEKQYLEVVAEVLNINDKDYALGFSFAQRNAPAIDLDPCLLINGNDKSVASAKHIKRAGMDGEVIVIRFAQADIMFAKYNGKDALTLNGQQIVAGSIYVITQGSMLRSGLMDAVYYSEILHAFLKSPHEKKISFDVDNIEYRFKSGTIGLHALNFATASGKLVGVMGGSGAGKSTLLNILNGSNPPSKGNVLINGINLHNESEKLEGIIGNIPQDDLLFEDLTVEQNLFYSTKLCMGQLSDEEIHKKVSATLESLGLSETKNLRVGNALNKVISGGQRKRLNIALELIREPSILFVDEPTSGLSSRDAENVMDLLKQLANSGKLVFVVIHQPSSDIFKMFDELLLLDTGGYPVYFGNPVDALIHFRRIADFAGADEAECDRCGNINPEQIFAIIEMRSLDEYGNLTNERKTSPHEWYVQFRKDSLNSSAEAHETAAEKKSAPPLSGQKRTGVLKQFTVFFTRDVLSKLSNSQYVLITMLEAPLLAIVLAGVLRYYEPGSPYLFSGNQNIPAYLFISVIVSLFLGLIVSAEEIIRDRKIQMRESFLNLSRNSYLLSKICVMFILSAVQSLTFVLLGNLILGIHGLNIDYFLIMFTTSCFANLLGLNISSGLNSVVTIYIVIPFLIIPQILLSGVIVKFDKLNPVISSYSNVPFIGNIMTSRWAFEALAVNQFRNNPYEKNFFDFDRQMSISTYKKDWWMPALREKIDKAERLLTEQGDQKQLAEILPLVKNEIEKENTRTPALVFTQTEKLNDGNFNLSALKELRNYMENLRQYYVSRYNSASQKKDAVIGKLTEEKDNDGFKAFKKDNLNVATDELLKNSNSAEKVLVTKDQVIQKFEPVFMESADNSFLRAPFFVSEKNFFGVAHSTFAVNLFVIWLMSILLYIALVTDALRKLLSIKFKR
jgi:ABC-type multidrug transport system ATPase subunit